MGRSVYADKTAEAYIEVLISKRQWYIGLILGQQSSQKDYVLCLARTPEAAEDEVCEESEIGKEEELPSKKKKSKSRPKSLDTADEQWLATHAKQVTRMLPGGLDVIGIIAVAPSDMLKISQTKLRQLMFAVHKSVTKNVPVLPTDAVTDRIILQIDSTTRKVVCSSVDVSDIKSTLRPAEWKYANATRWLQLESSVAVDVSVPVAHESQHQTLLKTMQQAVAPFCQDIWNSVALVSGEVRENSELLAIFPEGKKTKGKEKHVPTPETYHVDFLMPMGKTDIAEPKVTEVGKLVSVRGIIVCRAFVHWKASVKEAIQAMKTDVVRSLCARCELLSEDLELTDETSVTEFRQLNDTPVRVFTSATLGAQFCDYMFQDEKMEEVTDRIKELIDVSVPTDSLEISCEHPARDNDWVTASHSEHSLTNLQEPDKATPNKSNFTVVISLAVSGVVAAAAAAMSYFFMDNS